jgi:hypothetical protein
MLSQHVEQLGHPLDHLDRALGCGLGHGRCSNGAILHRMPKYPC